MNIPSRKAPAHSMPAAAPVVTSLHSVANAHAAVRSRPTPRVVFALAAGCWLVSAVLDESAVARGGAGQAARVEIHHDVTRAEIGSLPPANVLIVEGVSDAPINRMPPVNVDIRYDVTEATVGAAPAVNVPIVEDVTADRINRMPPVNVLIVEDVTADRVNRMPPVQVDLRHGVEEWYIGLPLPTTVTIAHGPSVEPVADEADKIVVQEPVTARDSRLAGRRHPARHARRDHFSGRPSPWATPVWTYRRTDYTYQPRQPQWYRPVDDTYHPTRSWTYIPRRDFTWTPWVWRRY